MRLRSANTYLAYGAFLGFGAVVLWFVGVVDHLPALDVAGWVLVAGAVPNLLISLVAFGVKVALHDLERDEARRALAKPRPSS